jgi:hypothetical protein
MTSPLPMPTRRWGPLRGALAEKRGLWTPARQSMRARPRTHRDRMGLTGQLSKHDLVWERIVELHAGADQTRQRIDGRSAIPMLA